MRIDQRNGGASSSAVNIYTIDRYFFQASQTGKLTWGQNLNSVTPPTGYTNYFGFQSSSAYSVLSGDYFQFCQPIEGYNVADLAWGSANAKTITLSFWVYSSLTGTFGGALRNSAGSRAYPFTYTIGSASTWTYITVVIPGDTTGTWLTTSGSGVSVYFGLGIGSSYLTTPNVWGSGGSALYPTGMTSVVGVNAATWYITGLQFEIGSVATPFERRLFAVELGLCERYFQSINLSANFGSANSAAITATKYSQYDSATASVPLIGPMRATPTISSSASSMRFVSNTGIVSLTIGSLTAPGPVGPITVTGSNNTVGAGYGWVDGVGLLSISAEL